MIDAKLSKDGTTIQLTTESVHARLSPEEALTLWQQLPRLLQSLKVPAMIVDDEYPLANWIKCPHCHHQTDVDSDTPAVIEVDWAWRGDNEGVVGFDDASVISIGQGQVDFETVVYRCAHCSGLVDLPSSTFNVNWS
jgi:hypothetical protein